MTAYKIYKSYTFTKNVQQTYILDKQWHFQQNILSNKIYLLSLAEITTSNFKDVCSDIAKLKFDTNNKFDRYLHRLIQTSADSIFYKNYVLQYINILHHLDHDLVTHNNRIEWIKTSLHMKCRNFISGLHILAKTQIPKSILHGDVFSNILHGVSQYLLKDNVYVIVISEDFPVYKTLHQIGQRSCHDAGETWSKASCFGNPGCSTCQRSYIVLQPLLYIFVSLSFATHGN